MSPRFTRPWRPRTNGEGRTLPPNPARRVGLPPPYTSQAERRAAFSDWLDWYNYHRPHPGISGHTSAGRVTNLPGQHSQCVH
ncbi:integrase core domain-containing protein [Streptomyces sp. NPDC051243]|uniref:integrase core domain-containing protein n=1 Tax=Streptomyces sp. NPDC051243 TaxID=3365646 RepID=UPI00379EDA06